MLGEHLDQALAGTVALGDQDDPPAVPDPAADVVDGRGRVTAVGLDAGRRRARGADALPASTSTLDDLAASRSRTALRRALGLGVEAERADASTTARPAASACVRTSPSERYAAAPRSIGACATAGRGRPGRLQELLAGRDQVVCPGPDPLGVADEHDRAGRQQVDQQLHVVDQHRRERLHALDRDGPRRACRASRPARGAARPARAARARTSSVSSSSRHGGAHSPAAASPASAGRRPRRTGSPRPCRPRTPPAAGAPRSAGTRRGCRRAPRTRRAARPGRPGGTPLRPAGVRRPRARPSSPALQAHRLEVGQARDLRLQHRAHRRDDDPDGPFAVVPSSPGCDQPTQHGEPPADRVGARATAARAAASPRPGSSTTASWSSRQRAAAVTSSVSRAVAVTARTVAWRCRRVPAGRPLGKGGGQERTQRAGAVRSSAAVPGCEACSSAAATDGSLATSGVRAWRALRGWSDQHGRQAACGCGRRAILRLRSRSRSRPRRTDTQPGTSDGDEGLFRGVLDPLQLVSELGR